MDEDDDESEEDEIDRLLAEFGLDLPEAEDVGDGDRLLDWGWD